MTTVLLLFQADREFFQFATLNRSIIVCFGIDICGTEIVHLSLYCLGSGSHHSTGIPQITVCNAYFLPGRLIQADSCPRRVRYYQNCSSLLSVLVEIGRMTLPRSLLQQSTKVQCLIVI